MLLLALHETNGVKLWVNELLISLDGPELSRALSMSFFGHQSFVVELGKTVSNQDVRALLQLIRVHSRSLKRNVVLFYSVSWCQVNHFYFCDQMSDTTS